MNEVEKIRVDIKKRICLRNIIRIYGVLFLSFGYISAISLGYLIYEPNLVLAFLLGITLSLSFNFFRLYKKKSREFQEIMINMKKAIDNINAVGFSFDSNNEGSEWSG